jgi:Flp pilus assembly protein TadG
MCSQIYKYLRYIYLKVIRVNHRGIDPRRGSGRALLRNARVFFRERSAVVAVEFAMIGAPFLLMILEIFQSALFVYCSGMLDHAAQAAARKIMTGSLQNGSLTAAQFRTNLLCPQLPATMPRGNVIVYIQTFSEAAYPGGFYSFVTAQTAIVIPPLDNSQTAFCPGGSGQYVYLQVFYAIPLIGAIWLPAVTATFNGKTVKLVSAAAAFKNEPYQSTYTPPAGVLTCSKTRPAHDSRLSSSGRPGKPSRPLNSLWCCLSSSS